VQISSENLGPNRGSVARWSERFLWAVGLLLLSAWCGIWLMAGLRQADGNRELDQFVGTSDPVQPSSRTKLGTLIGRMEIPRLQMSTVVFEGTGDDVLRTGIGHLPGTSLPGEAGNAVLAAHRDTYFRPLRNIRKGDRIDLVALSGTRHYRVDWITIVMPTQTGVLAPTAGSTLTLVTCYPFDWFGHAPKRFIVRAHELDDVAIKDSFGAYTLSP
jgi:sortase A